MLLLLSWRDSNEEETIKQRLIHFSLVRIHQMLLAITQHGMSPEGRTGIVQGKWRLMRVWMDSRQLPLGAWGWAPWNPWSFPLSANVFLEFQRQSTFPESQHMPVAKQKPPIGILGCNELVPGALWLFEPLLSSQKYCYSTNLSKELALLYPNSSLSHQSRIHFYKQLI